MSSAKSSAIQTFAVEAEEILQRLEGELDSLEGAEDAEGTIASLFREAHTKARATPVEPEEEALNWDAAASDDCVHLFEDEE
jgi:chemotaxis protein histidine kinase CheA